MIFTYLPEGQTEPTTWTVDLGKLRSNEMTGIEARTKMAYGTEFKQALFAGNTSARKAMLWTLQRREHHTLLFDDVEFGDDEVKMELDKKEWADLIDGVEKTKGLDPQVKADRVKQMQGLLDEAPEAPGKSLTPSETSEPPTD